MAFALVFENKVVEVAPAIFGVVSSMEWVDIDGITPAPEWGWSYDGTDFTPPIGPSLDKLKKLKRDAFKTETIVRMSAQVSAWNSFERIDFLLSISNLLIIANLTAAQTLAKDILLYTKNTAIPKINGIATKAELALVDPTLADPFGDGTAWPT